MARITAMIWAYNEEKRIESVINSLSEFDDIVLFDKSSIDKTREIAGQSGIRVVKVPYSDNVPTEEAKKIILDTLYELENNEWIFLVVCSDIIHWKLYDEMRKAIDSVGSQYQVIEVPIYRYSMGICEKYSYFGELKYQGDLFTREVLRDRYSRLEIVHEDPYKAYDKYRLVCNDSKIAVYHLTHENLEMVIERHERYARQYIKDCETNGKSRIQIMKYAWHEIVRTIWSFFSHRVFKLKWIGLAQCMMLIMYNAMIYLNAFFDVGQEKEIEKIFFNITQYCKKNN